MREVQKTEEPEKQASLCRRFDCSVFCCLWHQLAISTRIEVSIMRKLVV